MYKEVRDNYKNKIYYYIDSKPFTYVEIVRIRWEAFHIELNDEQINYVVSFLKEFDLSKVKKLKQEELPKGCSDIIVFHYTDEIVYDDQVVYVTILEDVLGDEGGWYQADRHKELFDYIYNIVKDYFANMNND